ncbi:hypothetical protein LJB88_03160 [Erysipelotrichaceae bacterium OttesenSCG-928-M19]|nr:hypothetical protein [Erysipelotrichaceae bacterium OttesenSCG-928-M19]
MQLGINVKEITINDRQVSINEVKDGYGVCYESARKMVKNAQIYAKEKGHYIYETSGIAILSIILELYGPFVKNIDEVLDIEKGTSTN